jgi:hypothetical protein
VLTHLIPPPATPEDEAAFADDLRAGGYTGRVTVGADLFSAEVESVRRDRAGHARRRSIGGWVPG